MQSRTKNRMYKIIYIDGFTKRLNLLSVAFLQKKKNNNKRKPYRTYTIYTNG
jgi:hypothetical protein